MSVHRDSLQVKYSELSNICDSLKKKVLTSPIHMERLRLEGKIKETKVINIPKDQEFLFWQAARGIDTTQSHLAYTYSNELKKIPTDTNEIIYREYNSRFNRVSHNIDLDNNEINLMISKIALIDLYIEGTKELPIYKAYIVYQALNKGGQNSLSEEIYYFNKNYKCLGIEYSEFWNELSVLD